MFAWTISRFRADVICSCRCVAPIRIYRNCEDNTISNLTQILQAHYVVYYKKDNVDSDVEHFMYLTKTFVVAQTVQYEIYCIKGSTSLLTSLKS